MSCASSLTTFLFLPALLLGRGDGTLEAPLEIRGVATPVSVSAGDFNRDGKLDLAAATGSAEIAVLLQDPLDRSAWWRSSLSAGLATYFVRAVDLDADGDDDLAVADPGSFAFLFLCRGDGSFDGPERLAETRGARWITSGDFNGDGKLDLASANDEGLTLSIYLGSGQGKLSFLKNYAIEAHSVEALDYDGGGALDLMLGVGFPGGIIPLQGKGDGSFEPRANITNLGGCIDAVVTGDFNRDRLGDLAPTCVHSNTTFAGISRGDGSYEATLTTNTGVGPEASAAGDLTGDGVSDLALAGRESDFLHVFVGKGDGTFLPPSVFRLGGRGSAFLISGDLDGDGRGDLVSADTQSSSLRIVWGSTGARFLAAGSPIEGFGSASALSIADLDRDGAPDLFIPRADQARVHVYLKPGAVAPEEPSFTIETAGIYTFLAVVDLDQDGLIDLAGAHRARGMARVALLDAAGKPKSQIERPAGLFPAGVMVGEIDGGGANGNLDLAVPCTGSDHIALFFGQGGGAFSDARTLPTIERPISLAIGDLDRDGRPDLAVISAQALALHFGEGGGEFTEASPIVLDAAKSFSGVAIADLDRDPEPDVAAGETRTKSLLFFRGLGGRKFEAAEPLLLDAEPGSLHLADFDRDGFPDIATESQEGEAAIILMNRGGLRFSPAAHSSTGFRPAGIALADLDRDGAIDVAAAGSAAGMILFGRRIDSPPGSFRRGETTGDGGVDLSDPVLVLSWLFLETVPLFCQDAADADDNGSVEVTDAVLLLEYLFLGRAEPPAPGPEDCGLDPNADALPECQGDC